MYSVTFTLPEVVVICRPDSELHAPCCYFLLYQFSAIGALLRVQQVGSLYALAKQSTPVQDGMTAEARWFCRSQYYTQLHTPNSCAFREFSPQ